MRRIYIKQRFQYFSRNVWQKAKSCLAVHKMLEISGKTETGKQRGRQNLKNIAVLCVSCVGNETFSTVTLLYIYIFFLSKVISHSLLKSNNVAKEVIRLQIAQPPPPLSLTPSGYWQDKGARSPWSSSAAAGAALGPLCAPLLPTNRAVIAASRASRELTSKRAAK